MPTLLDFASKAVVEKGHMLYSIEESKIVLNPPFLFKSVDKEYNGVIFLYDEDRFAMLKFMKSIEYRTTFLSANLCLNSLNQDFVHLRNNFQRLKFLFSI